MLSSNEWSTERIKSFSSILPNEPLIPMAPKPSRDTFSPEAGNTEYCKHAPLKDQMINNSLLEQNRYRQTFRLWRSKDRFGTLRLCPDYTLRPPNIE
jgi:hypothetical protein